MNQTKKCPQCGVELPTETVDGLCPKCLLEEGLRHSNLGGEHPSEDATIAAASPAATDHSHTVYNVGNQTQTRTTGTKIRYVGDYELIEEIGRGGMGVVYKARQVSLNRIVALKMILTGQLASDLEVKRFATEAEAAAQLDHPGIVPIYEVGEHAGQHYFSMGFVEGESLADKIKEGPLAPREAARCVHDIAVAIDYAHQCGVIHRDLKPANILLGTPEPPGARLDDNSNSTEIRHSCVPKITDFGLAKRVEGESELTVTGQVLGTPSFMPPEQASGRFSQVRESADIYALGALLYATVTGRPPFQADNPLDTLIHVLEQEPVPPRQLNPALPRDMETICLKCLNKESQHRYETAQEVADELHRFLSGQPIQARPVSAPARLWRWSRRNPIVAALVALVIALLITGTTVSSYFAIQANHRADEAEASSTFAKKEQKRANDKAAEAERNANQAQQESERARANLYTAHISLAKRVWDEAAPDRVKDLLNRHRPGMSNATDLRGFEWYYLNGLGRKARSFDAFTGTSFRVSLAYSRDGRWLATGGSELKIWDAKSGKSTFSQTIKGGDCLDFNHDGTHLAMTSGRDVIIINVENGEEVQRLEGHKSWVNSLAYSPDGQFLVTGGNRTAMIWNVTKGTVKATLSFPRFVRLATGFHDVRGVAISPDGTQIATSSYRALAIWDAHTGRFLRFNAHDTFLQDVSFSPDGKWLVSGSWDGIARISTVKDGREVITLRGHANDVKSVAFSPDGKLLVTGSTDRTVRIWDSQDGTALRTFRGHTHPITRVRFHPDGKRVASIATNGTVKIWDANVDQNARELTDFHDTVPCVAFQENAKRVVAVGFPSTMRVWDTNSGSLLKTFPKMGRLAAFFGPGFLWGGKSIESGGKSITIITAAFSGDGQLFASGDRDGNVLVWDATNGKLLKKFKAHADKLDYVALNYDGKYLASGGPTVVKNASGQIEMTFSSPEGKVKRTAAKESVNGEIKIWELDKPEPMHVIPAHASTVARIAFTNDGKLLASVGGDGTVKVWDAISGKKLGQFGRGRPGVSSLLFDAMGKLLFIGDVDGNVHIWDLPTKQGLGTLQGHTTGVAALAITADGTRLASGDEGGFVKVWDAKRHEELLTLPGRTRGVRWLAFSPDATRLVSSNSHGEIKIWDAPRD